jgi:hypothetical protein
VIATYASSTAAGVLFNFLDSGTVLLEGFGNASQLLDDISII